jgi:hypothetical protein
VPQGMESAERGIEGDEDVVHREDEDEETGNA